MAEIKIHFNVAMVIAVILAEAVSMLWYAQNSPWGQRIGERYLLSALICDAGLVVMIKFVMENHWRVSSWEDALFLSMWMALLYFCLEGPHVIHNARSFSRFFFHALHKLSVAFVMCWALVYFKDY
ncbi:uncharacterized protein LOC143279899 [Babylonia areolata]|uniref:uncharacterized protein LOC143279899 n=1 Tax=Babylonia areolata TaxID=304850 RepID=UPI003FD6BC07